MLVLAPPAQDSRPYAGLLDAKLPRAEIAGLVRDQLRAPLVRTVAWGAYNAGTHGLKEAVPELRRALGILKGQELTDQKRHLVLAALDALVTLDARLPPEEIQPWLNAALRPALILASRSAKDSAGLLRSVLSSDVSDAVWHTTCNLLLDADPAWLASGLLEGLRISVSVFVQDPGIRSGRFSWRKGRYIHNVPEDFPPTPYYHLSTTDEVAGWVPFALGPEVVSYLRIEYRSVGGSFSWCSRDDWHKFDRAGYAIRCLQELAGLDTKDRSLCSPLGLMHEWLDVETYVAAVEARLKETRERWAVLLASLANGGLIARAAIEDRPLLMTITVEDQREDPTIALPDVSPLSRPSSAESRRSR